MAGVSKISKVLKAYRQGLPWGDYESPVNEEKSRIVPTLI
jgi:hypothetical protein